MSELDLLKKELFGNPNGSNISDIKLWPGARQTSPEQAAREIRMALEDSRNNKTIPVTLDY